MQYCYCLFCETKKCTKVASALELNGMDRAFSPQIILLGDRENWGKTLICILFYFRDMYLLTLPKISKDSMLKVDGIIQVLGLAGHGYCLYDKDYDFALELLNRDGIINVMHILQVGDAVEILDPLFKGCKGSVLQLDRRKQPANKKSRLNLQNRIGKIKHNKKATTEVLTWE